MIIFVEKYNVWKHLMLSFMKYNFDEIIDRSHTAAVKWDGLNEVWGRTDLIPMWVADMDFATAPFVLEEV